MRHVALSKGINGTISRWSLFLFASVCPSTNGFSRRIKVARKSTVMGKRDRGPIPSSRGHRYNAANDSLCGHYGCWHIRICARVSVGSTVGLADRYLFSVLNEKTRTRARYLTLRGCEIIAESWNKYKTLYEKILQ